MAIGIFWRTLEGSSQNSSGFLEFILRVQNGRADDLRSSVIRIVLQNCIVELTCFCKSVVGEEEPDVILPRLDIFGVLFREGGEFRECLISFTDIVVVFAEDPIVIGFLAKILLRLHHDQFCFGRAILRLI